MKRALTLAVLALALTACNVPASPAPTVKNAQAKKAAEAANSITFVENAEIDNIKRRIEQTSRPGAMGFVILLNQSGQPVMYEGVKGKITSGSKRLTDPTSIVRKVQPGNAADTYLATPAPSDEGTFGSSGEYVFYWNQNDEYRQWNGSYLYSDKPFRLRVEPLVVNVN
ncbi:hypothetical protein PMNALOAF_2724 [Methylobacterium adhaesivum]|uniref:Lipoprotein n=1 Tax=Methylobacterium adhaesivum TaxID=333297 RepID=A0ABT8BJT2_9HYPH|nr:hypothetical protein [Methylobacterium adhaesivum]MDN3592078.1 hypothetical protein [Methylobacterium adhaesivum]GJD31465.1 hypothetical protein PMNALOAF_2724 [Methylobacterium adhaesivum]